MSNTDARDPSNTSMQTTQQGGAMTTQQPGALQSVTSKIFDQFPEQNYNVLAPRTHMDGLPAGTRLAITEVRVNPDKNAGEVFPIAGGQLLVGKPKLDAISAAAGISWLEENRTDPKNGEMVVALLDDASITLKRLRSDGKKVWLMPENPEFQPIRDPFKLVGKVVGVLRKY